MKRLAAVCLLGVVGMAFGQIRPETKKELAAAQRWTNEVAQQAKDQFAIIAQDAYKRGYVDGQRYTVCFVAHEKLKLDSPKLAKKVPPYCTPEEWTRPWATVPNLDLPEEVKP